MLQSYEAIDDHGRLTWTGEAPQLVRGRVMVTLVNDLADGQPTENNSRVPNGDRIADLLTEMAEKGIGKIFGDPMEWQREVRRDRPLPGREEE
ncbi:MAG: hypothetical protein H7836_12665 [Magnetococcus sp. YQC-3]